MLYDDDINKALFHGHTLRQRVGGIASLELLQTSEMQANIVRVNHSHLEFEKRVKKSSSVTTRVLGVILL
jgi:adenosylmethionine-8-amino-7-oxononanoate aminotransferase